MSNNDYVTKKDLAEAVAQVIGEITRQNAGVNARFEKIEAKLTKAVKQLRHDFSEKVMKRYDKTDERVTELEFRVSDAVGSYQRAGDTQRKHYDIFLSERVAIDHALSRHQVALDEVALDIKKLEERMSALESKPK